MHTHVGIVSFGAYVPCYRVTVEEISTAHQFDGAAIKKGLLIGEKSVPGHDEDTVTLSIEAGSQALKRKGIAPDTVGAIYIGSESHPYAVKPSATIVAQALGFGNEYMAVDMQFACKAGTAAIQCVMGQVASGMIDYGMAIGADTAQAEPQDALEYTAGAGAAAFLLGNKEEEIIASIDTTVSFSSDTPDFWRRPGQKFPKHAERFTGQPAYFHHVIGAGKSLLKKTKTTPEDYTYAIFHQPNGKFPRVAAKKLGFSEQQVQLGILADKIGNCYAGSSLLGLAHVLEQAQPGEKIFFVSYGSGSGSDGFTFTVTKGIEQLDLQQTLSKQIEKKIYVSYDQYKTMSSH